MAIQAPSFMAFPLLGDKKPITLFYPKERAEQYIKENLDGEWFLVSRDFISKNVVIGCKEDFELAREKRIKEELK